MKNLLFLIGILGVSLFTEAKEYHVSVTGNDSNKGNLSFPFKTINRAAQQALPGDTVTVHAGIYREWVNPQNGGTSDNVRIVYRASEGEKVEIKGSEVIKGWKNMGKGIWKVVLPNTFFGNFNPYKEALEGDWIIQDGRVNHLGEVYLNNQSFFEVDSLDKLTAPKPYVCKATPEGNTNFWYCESNDENTTIWVRFGKYDPNKETVEISVRPTCFYPEKQGLNYITIQGFEISQAATRWASPTNEQVGIVSTHWCKGWIIENNIIHDSKCTGITLGKERSTGHNVLLQNPQKNGAVHYIEVVFNTLRYGWSKENVGSHIVRCNTIYNCEHTGICGMAAIGSEIVDNHIYDIYTKRQYYGEDIAAIKFHGGIDLLIKNNRIHDSFTGLWLDWMTQGTRVSSNLFYRNDRWDLHSEVNHGPDIIDNNIFLSPVSVCDVSEGEAFVHNLIAGNILFFPELSRFTPYHLPHSTEIAGFSVIAGGDNRYYNNLFIGKKEETETVYGLAVYDKTNPPIYAEGNVSYNGAKPYKDERYSIVNESFDPKVQLEEKGDDVYLVLELDENYFAPTTKLVNTELLGKTQLTGLPFENPDGTLVVIDRDYLGNPYKTINPGVGPFSNLKPGKVRLKVW